ncbi:amino acid adenylation domain-containing protein [Actinokineospora diospyrosa]|uniref:L-prolyl-[peptidyl carrier protein] synthetase n=1 Tax=Actinokineospora diospyrosa TaxID=103728 RepID=A0ABT1IG14_9PSEU|nr:amino acid adenylation domain-containing protein [Actinokineospora diospyrosa]MCP2271577.1 L-prolyl-[peptidyl carrier protein] synthetase [Actinokineospora diospyrosa]
MNPLDPRPVHELICRQAERTPDAVAVRDGDTVLTYRELLDAAAAVAGQLAGEGIGPGAVVGLCVQRSARLVATVLGVLLSGAAYLPVDPAHPPHRVAAMLASAQASLLLVDGKSPLPDDHPVPVRSIDEHNGAPAPRWRGYVAGPEVVCCVIFTSGSTGEPKGVEITHRALAIRLVGMLDEHQVDSSDVLLQKAPYTFDVSMWELLLGFLAGATLVVAPPEAHRDPEALVELIVRHGVTVVHFVPSMLALFVTEPGFERCRSLRMVLCGGEPLPPRLVNTLGAALPAVTAYNMYGPAEATIDVTAWKCRRPEPGATVPIGHPLRGVHAHVVDEHDRPAASGELLLAGDCLARGYAGRPDLTADRFAEVPGIGRAYRTGDLVRRAPEGHLEYLGRIDTQVKIRGQRVELGEVESTLRTHPAVHDAVVALRDGRSLVGYVVLEAGAALDEPALRGHLAERLPEYMVPTRVVGLAAIPTTAHGKADRAALPAPPRRR